MIRLVHTPACDACGRSEHLQPDNVLCDPCRAEGRGREGEPTWHVVTSHWSTMPRGKATTPASASAPRGGRVILAVYGGALLSHAQECARRVQAETGFPAFVNQVLGTRPRVGDPYVP